MSAGLRRWSKALPPVDDALHCMDVDGPDLVGDM
jgi:hypothetical protein